MRRLLAVLSIAALSACGAPETSSRTEGETAHADMSAAAPGLSVTAAPGVAFDYRYAFRLPSARIAAVQEGHAQACEQLGLAKCRITGARYKVVGQGEIEAMLSFKLDPTAARSFGKAGVEAVGKAEGMLVDAEINGRELGGEGTAAERKATLATTPMAFHYGSGELIPGFDTRGPIRAALSEAGGNFIAGVSALLVLLITVAPWVAFALFVWWAVLRLRARFGRHFLPEPVDA
jgi:hypothetical protein